MLCTPQKVPAALSSEGGGCGFKLELIFFAFMQKIEVISESPSGVCSTEPGQAGKGMGEKCHGKRGDWDTGTPRPARVGPGLCSWEIWTREGRANKYKKNIDIKLIWVEEEEEKMDSKGRVTVVFPKARIIIKKIPVEVTVKSPTEFPSLGENKNTNEVPFPPQSRHPFPQSHQCSSHWLLSL